MPFKKNATYAALTGALLVWIFICTAFSCNHRENGKDDLRRAAEIIRDHAVKTNSALKGKGLRATLSIDGGIETGTCMCLKVCDVNGENCTPCTCDPAGCGSCD